MRKLRVNIFDDDVRILKMLELCMSKRDYEVLTFERPIVCPIYSIKTGTCNNLNPCADIIITDYRMPGMTGVEMLLRQAQRGCKVDIRNKIVISGCLDNKGQKILEELGCIFLNKPFKFSEFLACLDDCEKRIDLSKPLAVKRKEYRCPANIDIVYAYGTDENMHEATVMNYSSRGLCLKVDTPLTERQSIVIKTDLPIDCCNASIRWVKQMEPDFYMAGCSCG